MKQKNSSVIVCFFVLLLTSTSFAESKIDPRLKSFAKGQGGQSVARVIAIMENKLEAEVVPAKYHRSAILSYLKKLSSHQAKAVAKYLRAENVSSKEVSLKRTFYVNNSLLVEVTPRGLAALSHAPSIVKIYLNAFIHSEPARLVSKPVFTSRSLSDNMPYDFKEIGMDKLISEMPEVTGKGVLLGHCDTGVDGKHPALKGKIQVYYDAVKKKVTDPVDSQQHGTHTAGTMIGGNRSDNVIGMAPDAKLVASGIMGDYSTMLEGMEFMLHPEGNDLPRAVSNSWNCGGAPDMELFYRAVGAWESAGVMPVFSAGNSGPNAGTITPPHEHPMVFAVASSGPSGGISSFSSRGPGKFHGQETQKPDVTAPGEDIFSSLPEGKYGKMSGTSMAAPHVTGAVALILQVAPKLNPTQVRQILLKSATPVAANGKPGTAGEWNATFGFGKMNVYEAVKLAKKTLSETAGRFVAGDSMMDDLFISSSNLDAQQVVLSEEVNEPFLNVFNYPMSADGENWVTLDQLMN